MRLSLRASKNWASTPPKRTSVAPRRQPMTTAEFRSLCAQLDINDNETASELLGPSWRTCQRYWYGELDPPESFARFLRLAAKQKVSHADLRALISSPV
jgi:hypothetical protein